MIELVHERKGIFLPFLALLLFGYAVMGRSFAYIGVPPLYVGEMVMAIGLMSLPFVWKGNQLFKNFLPWLLLIMMVWGSSQTIPYVGQYGVLAIRDAVTWGYAVFAFIVAMTIIAEPKHFYYVLKLYQRFSGIFPYLAFAVLLIQFSFMGTLPKVFGNNPLFLIKPGDTLIHLAAILAFTLSPLSKDRSVFWFAAFAGAFLLTATVGRGGMLAFFLSVAVIIMARPLHTRFWKIASIGLVLIILVSAFGSMTGLLTKIVPGKRMFTVEQIVDNVQSIIGTAEGGAQMQGTKEYRLAWWSKIADYTFHGQYFWTGKGFGINLATDDGFQLKEDEKLRSPHNGHLTMLARAGVPGIILWLCVQCFWAISIFYFLFKAKLDRRYLWESWFLTLFVYWLATMVNASFDPFLEGPMGGIWFWTVYGVGFASMYLYREQPEMLE